MIYMKPGMFRLLFLLPAVYRYAPFLASHHSSSGSLFCQGLRCGPQPYRLVVLKINLLCKKSAQTVWLRLGLFYLNY